jgi:Zn-dependent protease/CBS domain-containing protein
MGWSVQIGRVSGIPIRLHITFLLLLGWLAYIGFSRGNLTMLLLAVGLFACVLLHELGHSIVAQRYGIQVLDITLLPIGGLARMAALPRKPRQELWIAIAGPAVNFVLAPLLYAAHWFIESPPAGLDLWQGSGYLLGRLAGLNLAIGLFNLLPAFPMDGGRILRAVLAERMPYVRATQIAAGLGQFAAFGMGFLGLLLPNPLLIFIALFIFIGAAEEGARVQTQAFVEGVPVRDAMMTRFFTLERADSLGRAVDLLLAGTQQDFPVVEEEQVAGILTRRRLLEALSQGGRDVYVSEVMEPAPNPISPETPLEEALERMTAEGLAVIPVQAGATLCGLLTTDNAVEYILVRAALGRNQEGDRG